MGKGERPRWKRRRQNRENGKSKVEPKSENTKSNRNEKETQNTSESKMEPKSENTRNGKRTQDTSKSKGKSKNTDNWNLKSNWYAIGCILVVSALFFPGLALYGTTTELHTGKVLMGTAAAVAVVCVVLSCLYRQCCPDFTIVCDCSCVGKKLDDEEYGSTTGINTTNLYTDSHLPSNYQATTGVEPKIMTTHTSGHGNDVVLLNNSNDSSQIGSIIPSAATYKINVETCRHEERPHSSSDDGSERHRYRSPSRASNSSHSSSSSSRSSTSLRHSSPPSKEYKIPEYIEHNIDLL